MGKLQSGAQEYRGQLWQMLAGILVLCSEVPAPWSSQVGTHAPETVTWTSVGQEAVALCGINKVGCTYGADFMTSFCTLGILFASLPSTAASSFCRTFHHVHPRFRDRRIRYRIFIYSSPLLAIGNNLGCVQLLDGLLQDMPHRLTVRYATRSENLQEEEFERTVHSRRILGFDALQVPFPGL